MISFNLLVKLHFAAFSIPVLFVEVPLASIYLDKIINFCIKHTGYKTAAEYIFLIKISLLKYVCERRLCPCQ